MGEVFKEFVDKVPAIIGKAAQSPLGLASLIVLVLGALGGFLFWNAAGRLRLLAFAMITGGLLGLFIFASNSTKIDNPGPKPISPKQTEQIRNQAAIKLAEAERLNFTGQNDQARAVYDQAVTLYEQIYDRNGQANALFGLGRLEHTLRRDDQAREAFVQAIVLYRQEDNRIGLAKVLAQLGDVESSLGHNVLARADFDDAIPLFKQEDNLLGQADVLNGLGELESRLGRNDEARAAYDQAITLYKQIGDRIGQANVLRGLGDLESRLGLNSEASAAYNQAITLYKQQGSGLGQANVLSSLGALVSSENPQQAATYFVEAAQLYERIGMMGDHNEALRRADVLSKK
jgi:tetratricopeptide (TPR) repeat protein